VRVLSDKSILVLGIVGAVPFIVGLNEDGSVNNNFGSSGYLPVPFAGLRYARDIYELSNGQLLLTGATNFDFVVVRTIDESNVPHISYNGWVLSSTGGDSYQWYADGNVISGATNSSLEPPQNGYYQMQVTDEWGCTYISDSFLVENSAVEVLTNEHFFKLFPNPVNGDYLFFDSGEEKIIEVLIADLSGKELRRISNESGIQRVNFDLPGGAYMVSAKTNNTIASRIVINVSD